jgi:hypothetical protein
MTQDRIIIAASMVEGLDIAGFLKAVNISEALGPFVDPTLFMQASKKLGQIKRMAEGARQLQQAAQGVAEEREAVRG